NLKGSAGALPECTTFRSTVFMSPSILASDRHLLSVGPTFRVDRYIAFGDLLTGGRFPYAGLASSPPDLLSFFSLMGRQLVFQTNLVDRIFRFVPQVLETVSDFATFAEIVAPSFEDETARIFCEYEFFDECRPFDLAFERP